MTGSCSERRPAQTCPASRYQSASPSPRTVSQPPPRSRPCWPCQAGPCLPWKLNCWASLCFSLLCCVPASQWFDSWVWFHIHCCSVSESVSQATSYLAWANSPVRRMLRRRGRCWRYSQKLPGTRSPSSSHLARLETGRETPLVWWRWLMTHRTGRCWSHLLSPPSSSLQHCQLAGQDPPPQSGPAPL